MGGCRSGCFLFKEDHDFAHLTAEEAMEAEAELRKYYAERPCDLEKLSKAVRPVCLANYLDSGASTKTKCRHFWTTGADLSDEARITIHQLRSARKWKLITVLVAVAGAASSGVLGYANYKKPTAEQVASTLTACESDLAAARRAITKRDSMIAVQEAQLRRLKTGVAE